MFLCLSNINLEILYLNNLIFCLVINIWADKRAFLHLIKNIMKLSLFFLFSILISISSHATNYYVSTNGSNTNSGLSLGLSWATLQYASDHVVAGDCVLVANGTYVGCYIDVTGTAAKPIVFKAIGNNVVINQPNGTTNDGINVENCDWIVIDGFRVINQPRTGIRVVKADNCVVRNNFCDNNARWGILTGFAENIIIEYNECSNSQAEHGIYFSNSADNPIIRYNKCHHNSNCGIHMNGDVSLGGDGIITNARVEGNIIYENGTGGGSGINCDGVSNSIILNNLLYANHASGISLYQIDGGAASTNNKVFNNTIINASNARWCLNITDSSTGNTVLNNILINQNTARGSITISANSLTNFSSNNNIVVNKMSKDDGNTILNLANWQSSGYDVNSLLAAVQTGIFVNPAGADFHLLSASQAIDNGSALVSSVVLKDMELNSRPQGAGYDMGCYEYMLPTSIPENFTDNDCTVFPNPATTTLMVTMNDERALEIYNMTGQLLNTYRLSKGSHAIDISHLASGLYLIRSGKAGKKLVVK